MRRLVLVTLTLSLAIPAAAWAQTVSEGASSLPTGPGDQAKPPATAPAAAPQTPAAPAVEVPHSLFDQTWHQFQFGARLTNIDGDPARFQRYQDIRDGVLFTDAKYATEAPEGDWSFKAAADNVGWRDQRFFGDYERTGRFTVSGLWNEIPQFYSVDTATPYTHTGDNLVLDDATQRAIQSGQGNLSSWIPLAPQFKLQERRDVGTLNFVATPTPQLDVKASYTMNRHVGALPWGASFGFGNDVEVALPYDSRANDFTLGAEWTNTRSMLNVAYTGSWFDNLDTPLVWDSPLRLDDSTSAPGRGRTALWPSNSAQTVSIGGFSKFAHRTQLTGFISFGSWKNDETLQPFTINSALTQLPLPRNTAQADAGVFSTNLNLVSRPQMDWRFSARFRRYDYSNNTPHFTISQYVSYDTSVNGANTGGPELYAHNRTNFDADATWTKLQPVAFTVGYSRNNSGHDFRIFESTGEDVFRLTADAVGSQAVSFRAEYEHGSRTGSGLNEDLLVEIEELLRDARPERFGAPVLEVRASTAADKQGVAGEDAVAPQVRDASRRMSGGGDRENLLVPEKDHVAVPEQAVVALRIAVPADRGLRAGGLLERVRGGYVVGVHVGFERVLESEAVLAQEAHVALDLLDDRIDQHRLVASVVGDEIRESGRGRIEELFEEHGILRIRAHPPA